MKQPQPTNFKDDIMTDTMGGKRRYRLINNADGTVSLEDVTSYAQTGSIYGAAQVNAANTAINASADAGKIIDDANALKAVTEDGYIAGAKAVADLVDEVNSNISNTHKSIPISCNFYAYHANSGYLTIDLNLVANGVTIASNSVWVHIEMANKNQTGSGSVQGTYLV